MKKSVKERRTEAMEMGCMSWAGGEEGKMAKVAKEASGRKTIHGREVHGKKQEVKAGNVQKKSWSGKKKKKKEEGKKKARGVGRKIRCKVGGHVVHAAWMTWLGPKSAKKL